ncbi:hypothetical protein COCON_G00049520, partial [Conger conger]
RLENPAIPNRRRICRINVRVLICREMIRNIFELHMFMSPLKGQCEEPVCHKYIMKGSENGFPADHINTGILQ